MLLTKRRRAVDRCTTVKLLAISQKNKDGEARNAIAAYCVPLDRRPNFESGTEWRQDGESGS